MAVIPATMEVLGQGLVRVTWFPLEADDEGEPVLTAAFSDRTVQATGDGTSVAIVGSNNGTNGVNLNDAGGTEIALDPTNDELVMIRENPLYIWPVVTGGTATSVILIGTTER